MTGELSEVTTPPPLALPSADSNAGAMLGPIPIDAFHQRLGSWCYTTGSTINPTPADIAEVARMLNPNLNGESFTSVPARDALRLTLPPDKYRATLLTAMVCYRVFCEVTGKIEVNPYALPDLPFMLTVLKDGSLDQSTKNLAYMVMSQGAAHHRYQLNGDNRAEFVDALKRDLQADPQNAVITSAARNFYIKDIELVGSVPGSQAA